MFYIGFFRANFLQPVLLYDSSQFEGVASLGWIIYTEAVVSSFNIYLQKLRIAYVVSINISKFALYEIRVNISDFVSVV